MKTSQNKDGRSPALALRVVRRLPIDWRAINKETGCTRGMLSKSPVFGWGVRGNGPADFCCITPPAVGANEELRIEEGMWAVYAPNVPGMSHEARTGINLTT